MDTLRKDLPGHFLNIWAEVAPIWDDGHEWPETTDGQDPPCVTDGGQGPRHLCGDPSPRLSPSALHQAGGHSTTSLGWLNNSQGTGPLPLTGPPAISQSLVPRERWELGWLSSLHICTQLQFIIQSHPWLHGLTLPYTKAPASHPSALLTHPTARKTARDS